MLLACRMLAHPAGRSFSSIVRDKIVKLICPRTEKHGVSLMDEQTQQLSEAVNKLIELNNSLQKRVLVLEAHAVIDEIAHTCGIAGNSPSVRLKSWNQWVAERVTEHAVKTSFSGKPDKSLAKLVIEVQQKRIEFWSNAFREGNNG